MTDERKIYNNIEELEHDRTAVIKGMKEQGMYQGFKDTLTKLYTSSGHFIFELLQNAEDCKAKKVIFDLHKDKLIFIHDGTELFTLENVDSITNVGNSTKLSEGNSIGKFGVGFKSVFEYTNTPEIQSGDFHFIINDLFIPHSISKTNKDFSSETTFILPFNYPGKNSTTCYSEIWKTLKELQPDTLLFLRNIEHIVCKFESREINLTRKEITHQSDNSVPHDLSKFSKYEDDITESNDIYYLRYFDNINIKLENDIGEKKNIEIGIAFNVNSDNKQEWYIKPLFSNCSTGKVFTFFPCSSENSGLCFHINAPFALTVDREKLRDKSENLTIIDGIEKLLEKSLIQIKNDHLLNLSFLETLPNNEDSLGKYEIIKTIKNKFINDFFTPMQNGSYEPAKGKFRSRRQFSSLFNDSDMNILFGTSNVTYWIKNPRQINQRDDKFLQGLCCQDFGIKEFLDKFYDIEKDYNRIISLQKSRLMTDYEKERVRNYKNILAIFLNREITWYEKFYTQLDILMSYESDDFSNYTSDEIKNLPFCYTTSGKLCRFSDCYIATRDISVINGEVNFLHPDIYKLNSKNNRLESFFNKIGMEQYSSIEAYKTKFKKYIVNDNSIENLIELFRDYVSLEIKDELNSFFEYYSAKKFLYSNQNNKEAPNSIFIPESYKFENQIKNISKYYTSLNTEKVVEKRKYALSDDYLKSLTNDKEISQFVRFLTKIGCLSSICIQQTSCRHNSNWKTIKTNAENGGARSEPTDYDYNIENLGEFLNSSDFEKFEFVWSLLLNQPLNESFFGGLRNISECCYRTSQKDELKSYPSQLLNVLSKSKWVAQIENDNLTFALPKDAVSSLLPGEKYLEDIKTSSNLSQWLDKLKFNEKEKIHQQENEQYKKDAVLLEEKYGIPYHFLRKFQELKKDGISITDEQLIAFFNDIKGNKKINSENNAYSNNIDEERIKAKIKEKLDNSTDIKREIKERNIRTSNMDIKKLAKVKLLNRYTNDLTQNVICQICSNPMPFKDQSNNDYFIVHQLFSSDLINKELEDNYIALCPVCSAKYDVYIKNDFGKQQELLEKIQNNHDNETEFNLLMDHLYTISFNLEHIFELKEILTSMKNNKLPEQQDQSIITSTEILQDQKPENVSTKKTVYIIKKRFPN